MDNEIRRELRLLKVYATVITALLGTVSLAAFRQASQKQRFTEIDVERINIVEPDGKLRMVISNRPRSIGPIYKGKPFGYAGGSRPGIIFFNDEGTENGGLTFEGKRQPDGTFRAQSGFSFDQFNQDQVLYFQYNDNNGRRNMGLTIADRADVDIYDLVAERDSITKAIPEGPARTAALQKWAQPRNGVPLAAGYAATADPINPGWSGSRFFAVNADRVLFEDTQTFKDNMPQTGPPEHGAEVR